MEAVVPWTWKPGVSVGTTICVKLPLPGSSDVRASRQERLALCYAAVGSMETALTRTADYLKNRRAYGKPLIDNQYISYSLSELSARLDILRHYNYAAAEAHIRGEDVLRFASVGKLEVGRLAREISATVCSSTEVSDTWKRCGPPGTFGTAPYGRSAAGQTRSCCTSCPAWTATTRKKGDLTHGTACPESNHGMTPSLRATWLV